MFIRVGMVVTGLAFASCNQVPTVRFGMINGLKVTETAHIPYQVGTHYGFRVDYHDSGRPIILREEFHLPGPSHWSSAQEFTAQAGGRIMTREVKLGSHTADPPKIHSMYVEDLQIAPRDPKGDYTVLLSLDGKVWKNFKFTIN
jgi:hypothetical protein